MDKQQELCCCIRHESLPPFHRIACSTFQICLEGFSCEQWFVEAFTNFNAIIWVFTEQQETCTSKKSQRIGLNFIWILTDLWIISPGKLMYSECIFFICTSQIPKDQRKTSTFPALVEVIMTWKIIKLPVVLKIAERSRDYYSASRRQKPQGYWGDKIKACLHLSAANFQGSLIFEGKLIALQLWGGNKE